MEKFSWSGAFALQKHISGVDYVPLLEMSETDWNVLDFPVLRPKARENLVREVVAGRLQGFFRVNYDLHKRSHGGKPTYFYPANDRAVDRYENGDYAESNFENFDGYAEEDVAEFPEFESEYEDFMEMDTGDVITFIQVAGSEEALNNDGVFVRDPNTEDRYRMWPRWALTLTGLATYHALAYEEAARLRRLAIRFGATEEEVQSLDKDELIELILELLRNKRR